MGRRTFSGVEVVKVLVNVGDFEWRRTTGDHAQLYYEHPTNEADRRQVTVPLHDELRTGTLRRIADDAGAEDFDEFCDRDTSAYPRLPVSDECSDALSEPRSEQAGVERTA
jgi:predicted RNA binding protein YcfA (HicA-like mRNA interferase family)